MLKTEESIVRKFPAGLVVLKISAKNRGLGVFSESQQGIRNATGSVAGDLVQQVDAVVIRPLGRGEVALLEQRAGVGRGVWTSIDSPSLSQPWSRGSSGSTGWS